MTTAYLGLDLHARTSTLGVMSEDGTYQGHHQVRTAESELVPRVASIDASEKRLAVEASELSRWAALSQAQSDVFALMRLPWGKETDSTRTEQEENRWVRRVIGFTNPRSICVPP